MICYECGHAIRRDFAKFCDHCGSSLEIKPKKASLKKEAEVKIEDEIDKATNLLLLWNCAIAATFIFYVIHAMTDGYIYLFLLVLFMLVVSWMLLLIKLHDLSIRYNQSTKNFILTNFSVPILGTFYSYIKLTQK
jgi:hypothetical protein